MLLMGVRRPEYRQGISHYFQMPVYAILSNIQPAALEPFHIRFLKIPFQDLVPFFPPPELPGHFAPESFGIFNAFAIGFFVFFERLNLIIHHVFVRAPKLGKSLSFLKHTTPPKTRHGNSDKGGKRSEESR